MKFSYLSKKKKVKFRLKIFAKLSRDEYVVFVCRGFIFITIIFIELMNWWLIMCEVMWNFG